MTRPLPRLLARAVGVALIALVLYLVGWNDRVVDAKGTEHVGRVVERTDRTVVLRQAEKRLVFEVPREVRYGLASAFSNLGQRPYLAVLGALLHLLGMLTTFYRWHILLRGADLATPARDVCRFGFIAQFMAQVLPGGLTTGDLVKAFYVARTHDNRKTRAVVTVFVDRVVGLLALCLIACVAVLFAPAGSRIAAVRTLVLVILAVCAAGTALVLSARVRHRLRVTHVLRRLPFQHVVHEAEQAIEIYARRPAVVVMALLVSFCGHAFFLGAIYFYGAALGVWLSPMAIAVAVPVALILSAIPALPGGWGVGDFAFYTFLPEADLPAAGVAAATAVAISFTYRLMHTLLGLPGGLWLVQAKERVDPDRIAEEMTVA
ncbi:MAG: lysylphosphatidylglycerol synthase transmembrane domain-containing protein [Planctomycetota bacterium]